MRQRIRSYPPLALLMASLVLLAVGLRGLATSPETERSSPGLKDLAWLAGTWRMESEGAVLEEQWAPPLGNVMTGMFRWTKNGQGWVYEFLLLEEADDGVTFYLRHFGPGCIAWEEKAEPFVYPVTEVSGERAVFENPKRDDPRRFIYRRSGPQLSVRVEGPDPSTAEEFRFYRVTSPTNSKQSG